MPTLSIRRKLVGSGLLGLQALLLQDEISKLKKTATEELESGRPVSSPPVCQYRPAAAAAITTTTTAARKDKEGGSKPSGAGLGGNMVHATTNNFLRPPRQGSGSHPILPLALLSVGLGRPSN